MYPLMGDSQPKCESALGPHGADFKHRDELSSNRFEKHGYRLHAKHIYIWTEEIYLSNCSDLPRGHELSKSRL